MFKVNNIGRRQHGFALPSVLIASIVMLTVLLAAITAVSASRTALSVQYYNHIAREAAESGLTFMIACIRNGDVDHLDETFYPNSTSCSNSSIDSSKSAYVLDLPSIKTKYRVQMVSKVGRYYTLEATGYTEQIRKSDGAVWRSYSVSSNAIVHEALLSPTEFAVVTRGYSGFVTLTDGTLWSWGQNNYGQLGDGTRSNRTIPQKVMDNVVQVAVTSNDATVYALTTTGSVYAWGQNTYGAVGNGSTDDQLTPTLVLSEVRHIQTTGNTAYAIKNDGSLWIWGRNHLGQVGDGTTNNRHTPYMVMSNGVKEVFHDWSNYPNSHVLKTDGSYWTWGSRTNNKIGDGGGSTGYQTTPVRILESNVKQITISTLFGSMSALMNDGTVYRWGYGLTATPQAVSGLSPIDRLVGSRDVTLALGQNGSLWTWGYNTNGNIGNGSTGGNVVTPYQVFSSGVKDVGVSRFQNAVIALRNDGTVWGWGKNNYCQLADGTTTDRYAPIFIDSNVSKIFTYSRGSYGGGASYPRFAVLKNDDSLYMWGSNFMGATGVGSTSGLQCTPAKVLDGVLSVADSDYYTTFAITSNGGYKLYSWGSNSYNQLGRVLTTESPSSRPGVVALPEVPPLYY